MENQQNGTNARIHFDYNGKGQQTRRIPEKRESLDANNEDRWELPGERSLASLRFAGDALITEVDTVVQLMGRSSPLPR